MFELKNTKATIQLKVVRFIRPDFIDNRGSVKTEAVSVWYSVSHIMEPLSRHVYVKIK